MPEQQLDLSLLALRTAVVDYLRAQLPASIDVEPQPGAYDLDELDRRAPQRPVVRVAITQVPTQALGAELQASAAVAAFIVSRTDRHFSADERALALGGTILGLVDGQRFGLEASAPTDLRWENLYATDIERRAAHLSAVLWQQSITLGAVDPEALDDFERLFADYDLAPPDETLEASDHIELEQ